jgi:hypothetical protein
MQASCISGARLSPTMPGDFGGKDGGAKASDRGKDEIPRMSRKLCRLEQVAQAASPWTELHGCACPEDRSFSTRVRSRRRGSCTSGSGGALEAIPVAAAAEADWGARTRQLSWFLRKCWWRRVHASSKRPGICADPSLRPVCRRPAHLGTHLLTLLTAPLIKRARTARGRGLPPMHHFRPPAQQALRPARRACRPDQRL